MKIVVEFNSKDPKFETIVKNVLNTYFKKNHTIINIIKPEDITLDSIEKKVCAFAKCKPEYIQLKTRERGVVVLRQICHHISKKVSEKHQLRWSLSTIGQRFGKKDHATVLYSDKTVKNLLETDKEFRNFYQSFIQSFD